MVAFEVAVKDVTGGNPKLQTKDYLAAGLLPVVDQGKALVAGYTNDANLAVSQPGPLVIFGDHTGALKYIDFPFALGADGVKVLAADAGLHPKYLYHFLHTVRLPDTGYDRKFKYLKRVNIPLPPLEEQRRIAAILDQAEELRAKRRAAITLLDQLPQAIFLEMFGDQKLTPVRAGRVPPGSSDRGWQWVRLTDVARLATGHTPDRTKSEYWNGSIPWISLTDIRHLDMTVATATGQCVTEDGISNSSSVKLPAGTVCFSRTASVGFLTIMGREMSTSQDFMNWVCGDLLDPVYLMWALRMSRAYMLSISSGSTHRTIYMRVVEEFHIHLPPIELQRQFAARVVSIQRNKAAHQSALTELDALFASLQSRAFSDNQTLSEAVNQ